VEVFMGLLQALGSACLVLAMIYYFDEEISLDGNRSNVWPGSFRADVGSRAILTEPAYSCMGRSECSLWVPAQRAYPR